jgi:glycosyltransferase involved in cell wall biosynthesis
VRQPRLRVLFNCPNPQLQGGPPTHLPMLEEELRQHVEVETFDYGRQTDDETLIRKLVSRSLDLIALRSKILTIQPHLIHHNTAFDNFSILRDAPLVWLSQKYNVPIFLKVHGSFDESFGKMNPLLERLRSIILSHVTCIGVLSDAEKKDFLTAWPSLAGRVEVVKNIIRPIFNSVSRRESELPTLLFISRVIRKKGIFDLLEAVPIVLKKSPTARFIVIGTGTDAAEFDRRVAEHGLSASVQRIGYVSNLDTIQFYTSAWTLVFPTHFPEGMPMVVAEAMAAGVPIITTRTRFSQSYMLPERHCLFIDGKNPLSIADAIVRLLESPKLRSEMSRNNRELAKAFDVPIVTKEYLEIYRRLTGLTPT